MERHEVEHLLQEVLRKQDIIMEGQAALMTAQDDINAAVAQLQQTQQVEATAVATLGTDVTAIQAALAAGGGASVDTSALNQAVVSQVQSDSALTDAVNSVTALVPPAAGS
jgi:hypothetical protein